MREHKETGTAGIRPNEPEISGASRSIEEGKVRARGTSRGRRKTGRKEPARRSQGRTGGRRFSLPVMVLALIIGFGSGLGTGWIRWVYEPPYTVDLKAVEVPSWVEQDFIRKNIFSRPDVSLKRINSIVIHYVANAGSTAQANRDYFDSLADQDPQKGGTSASAHFVVGLEGEVVQCIPVTEMAYAAAPRNDDTISIETCHPDDSGKFSAATYDSLVKLTACLCDQLKLTEKDVIRHYDVSGKECPKYYVEHEEEWKQFQEDVKTAIREMSWL